MGGGEAWEAWTVRASGSWRASTEQATGLVVDGDGGGDDVLPHWVLLAWRWFTGLVASGCASSRAVMCWLGGTLAASKQGSAASSVERAATSATVGAPACSSSATGAPPNVAWKAAVSLGLGDSAADAVLGRPRCASSSCSLLDPTIRSTKDRLPLKRGRIPRVCIGATGARRALTIAPDDLTLAREPCYLDTHTLSLFVRQGEFAGGWLLPKTSDGGRLVKDAPDA